MARVSPVLEKDLVIVSIDLERTPGGREMFNARKRETIPWTDVLDSEGRHVADSGPRNFGFPDTDEDIERFLELLKKGGVAEPEELRSSLRDE